MALERDRIHNVTLEEDMEQNFLRYAMSVIVSRALPDVRDGLKPSQRRILVAMNDLRLVPGGRTRKCMKIVGDTTGNYHPHGDQAVYATLVRLAQDWTLRYPLIIPQGNFGSAKPQAPAAARYTESKMSAVAVAILKDLDKDTVPEVNNYDQTRKEPTVLPGMFPNLLANGSSGIAVGMATSIPSHNIRNIADAFTALVNDADVPVDRLIDLVVAPDFATGGIIMGREAMREAYRTGQGKITLRAKTEIVERGNRQVIRVTEMPYEVRSQPVIDKILELKDNERIKGIHDAIDATDKNNPMLLEIELQRGANANIVLNQLFKYTNLQTTFSMNFIALVPAERDLEALEPYDIEDYEKLEPRVLNLKALLEEYRDHRYVMIRRRINHDLIKDRARAHILEGRIKALDIIDQIIALIRSSENTDEAQARLMDEHGFTAIQAKDILDLPLKTLTKMDRKALEDELKKRREAIAWAEGVLKNPKKVFDIMLQEMDDLVKQFGDDRRTIVSLDGVGEIDKAAFIPEEEVVVTITHQGYIKRTPLKQYRTSGRAAVGVIGASMKEGDFVEHLFTTNTHHYILIFSDAGKVYQLRVWDIPEAPRSARGKAVVNLLALDQDEQISEAYAIKEFSTDWVILMATRKGVVKSSSLADYERPRRDGLIAIRLDDGDALVAARIARGTEDVILGTKKGLAIRFPTQDKDVEVTDDDDNPILNDEGEPTVKHLKGLRTQGRATRGQRGIRLGAGDEVVGMIVVDRDGTILTVCEHGYGKRTKVGEYRLQSRGGKGVKNIQLTGKALKRNGHVVSVKDVINGDQLMMMSESGQTVRFDINNENVRPMGRATQGVRLKRLEEGDRIVAVARVPKNAAEKGEYESPSQRDEEDANGQRVAEPSEKKPATDDDVIETTSKRLAKIDADIERLTKLPEYGAEPDADDEAAADNEDDLDDLDDEDDG